MPYASDDDLVFAAGGLDRLVQLSDWDNDGVADVSVLAKAKDFADSLINSYASKRYDPRAIAANPSLTIRRMAAEEAIYYLRERRGLVSEEDRTSQELRNAWFTKLSEGKVRPDEPLPSSSSAVRPKFVQSDDPDRISRNRLKGAW